MNNKTEKLLAKTKIIAAPETHIKITDNTICRQECQEKYCTKFCPSNVFHWSEKEEKIIINYQQCMECLACPFGCAYQNIQWKFPPSGYGVEY